VDIPGSVIYMYFIFELYCMYVGFLHIYIYIFSLNQRQG